MLPPGRNSASVQDHDDVRTMTVRPSTKAHSGRVKLKEREEEKYAAAPAPTAIPPSPPAFVGAPFPQRREAPGIQTAEYRPGEIVVMLRGVAAGYRRSATRPGFNPCCRKA